MKQFLVIVFSGIGVFTVAVAAYIGSADRMYIAAIVLGWEGTRQAPLFDEYKFQKIKMGMPLPDVVKLLGTPLWAAWIGCDSAKVPIGEMFKVSEAEVQNASPPDSLMKASCANKTIQKGLVYTHQGDTRADYRIRSVRFENEKVVKIIKEFDDD